MSNLFTNFVTKGLEIEERDNRRILKGHITVEVVDRQNEFVAVNEVLSVIKNYFDVAPAIHDWHSNRPVGKALMYKKSEIEGHPSVYIEAEIFKKDGVTLYDNVWEKIVKGEYTGFSMGGASKVKEPMVKDGKLVMNLKSLELYEISVCPLPANPLAVFDYVNDFAKSLEVHKAQDGREYLQCSGVQCEFNKTHEKEEKKDIEDIEKSIFEITSDNSLTNIEKGLKIRNLFTKQYQSFQKPIRGHTWGHWQNKLKEENPDYTDDQVDATIASWEAEEKEKSTITKQMSREAELKMDEEPSGDHNVEEKKEEMEKDHMPNEKGTNEDVDVDNDNVKKTLQSMIRKNAIINMFVKSP